MDRRRARPAGWALAALSSALLVVGLVVLSASGDLPGAANEAWVPITIATTFPLVGALLVGKAADPRIGWLMVGTGLTSAVAIATYAYGQHSLVTDPGSLPGGVFAGWLSGWVWTLTAIPVSTLLPLLFPDGRPPSPRWRPVLWIVGVAIVAPAVAGMLAPGPLTNFPSTTNPIGVSWLGGVVRSLAGIGFVAFLVAVVLSIASVVVRWRAADGVVRTQLRCMVLAVLALGGALAWTVPAPSPTANFVACVATALLPVAIAVAVLRYRLYDVDVVVNRSLVYGISTAVLIGSYFAVVIGVSGYVGDTGATVLGTAVVALAFAPLREALQRLVDRMLFGLRDDPYTALRGLAERVDASVDITDVLPAVADAIRAALRVPYVEVHVTAAADAAPDLVVASGTPTDDCIEQPLMHRSQPVGRLVVGRRAGAAFSPADDALIADLAVSAGASAYAVALHADLAMSRERILVAREEERRRLRRDLHDGLGPALTGVVLSLQAGRNTARAGGDPEELLAAAEDRARQAIADVRRVVYDLRPPSLDDLGLEALLRAEAARLELAGTTVDVEVEGAEGLRALPAAIEVAALRIATEALTNVARHAGASRAALRLRVDDGLHITVTDDGSGLGESFVAGVGVTSMRDRARELGGSCALTSGPSAGTTVSAYLPLNPVTA